MSSGRARVFGPLSPNSYSPMRQAVAAGQALTGFPALIWQARHFGFSFERAQARDVMGNNSTPAASIHLACHALNESVLLVQSVEKYLDPYSRQLVPKDH